MIAFLFSGQGAQYPGMMQDIARENSTAGEVFDTADRMLNRSISGLCFEGSQEELNMTHNTQPCVLAADLAAYEAVVAAGIRPDMAAGFSLGEYAALTAAGVIRMEDVFPVIQLRADYMQEAVPLGEGAMAAVMKLSSEEVQALCDETEGYVVPANFNCPGQIVVSGEADAVDRLCAKAKEKKIRVMKLPVSAPFHCDLMAPAAEKLEEALAGLTFNKPAFPVYMNVDALTEADPEVIRQKLVLQAKSPVRFEETIRHMVAAGADTFIELGPGKTLSGFVGKTIKEGIRVFNVTDTASLKLALEALA